MTVNRAHAVVARLKPERADVYRRLLEHVFDYDSYQRNVSRRLAVVALMPVAA